MEGSVRDVAEVGWDFETHPLIERPLINFQDVLQGKIEQVVFREMEFKMLIKDVGWMKKPGTGP